MLGNTIHIDFRLKLQNSAQWMYSIKRRLYNLGIMVKLATQPMGGLVAKVKAITSSKWLIWLVQGPRVHQPMQVQFSISNTLFQIARLMRMRILILCTSL